jgi:hypothetical protein
VKVGDLVYYHSEQAHAKFGEGIVTDVYTSEYTVEVVWPKKSWTSRTISVGYLRKVKYARR